MRQNPRPANGQTKEIFSEISSTFMISLSEALGSGGHRMVPPKLQPDQEQSPRKPRPPMKNTSQIKKDSRAKQASKQAKILTVSLYFTKVKRMLTHSDFIFSMFFSREYSLLAAAPIGSILQDKGER